MDLSITTDYATDVGDPAPYLKRIADHGFSHIHWCHGWSTDFIYSREEIERVKKLLDEHGLHLLDLHGSAGQEKSWTSSREYDRVAGVQLVKNRIEMTARLSGGVTIMHIPDEPGSEPLLRSLGEIEAFAKARGVRLAIENGKFEAIRQVLGEFDPDYLGLCYDSGHGNLDSDGLGHLESLQGRLLSIHLHDNDGTADQHRLLFTGTVDWPRLARIIARSAYRKCVSMEVAMRNSGIGDEDVFLDRAFRDGMRFAGMIERKRRIFPDRWDGDTAASKGEASRRSRTG